jgi:transposase
MIHDPRHVGIDVSKTRFDVHIHPAGERFSCGTTRDEIAGLVRRLARLGPVAIGLEASGGYEARLADGLHAAGLAVHVLAPARIRGFARSVGQLARLALGRAAPAARPGGPTPSMPP